MPRVSVPDPAPAVPLAAAAAAAAAAATLGFLAGLRAGRGRGRRREDPGGLCAPCDSVSRRRGGEVCECGVILPSTCTEEERERHRTSTRHRKNVQMLENSSEVLVCEEVGEYRACAQALVSADDLVLEVGSHVGGTTKVLRQACGAANLVGLDQQADLVAQARSNLPDVRFEIGDAFDAQRVIALAKGMQPRRFTKVFIDISGSRDLPTVVRLIDILENTLRPDAMVVKSQTLKRLMMKSRLWIDSVQSGKADACRLPRRKGETGAKVRRPKWESEGGA